MRIRHSRAVALLVTIAALAIAGCGGGGKSSLPAVPSQQLGQKVGVTLTITLGTPPKTQSSTRKPAYVPTSAQSLVIEYIGNVAGATPAPGGMTPPSNVTVAATVNVTATATNPPPPGECFASGGAYTCTVNVQLPVGVIDLYILAYTGQNGTGTFLASSVTTAQVNSNATLTTPGTTTTIALNTLGAALGGVTLGAISAIVPNGVPKPSVTAASYPNAAAPNVYSAAGTITATDASNNVIPSNNAIQPVTITDTDTSGASCLVYIAAGASTATPCPFASAASSVTLSNTSDSYAVLYNGRYVPAGTLNIKAAIASPAPATTPSPITVSITPTIFAVGSATLSAAYMGPVATMLYDSLSNNVYVGMGSASTPLYAIPYSSSAGYGTPVAVNVTSVNGSAATQLTGSGGGNVLGGPNEMTIGPDNNIWFTENNGRPNFEYVAVAAIHSAVINPATGGTIQPGPGVFAEYQFYGPSVNNPNEGPPLKGIASMGGFIWIVDKDGDLWRIDSATGLVNPNLNTGFTPGQTPTIPGQLTDSTGSTPISGPFGSCCNATFFTPLIPIAGKLYIADVNNSSFDVLTVDTSTTPSAGICTPAGPPPCIGTVQMVGAGTLSGPYYGAATDGTSYYALNDSSNKIMKLTPPSTVTTSQSAFTSYYGGLGISPDGWIWIESSTGLQYIQGMSSAATAVTVTAPAACTAQTDIERGAVPMMAGPDGTWLYSPNFSGGTSTSPGVLCAVVY